MCIKHCGINQIRKHMKRVFLLFTFVFSFIGINAGIVETNSSLKFEITAKRLYAAQPKSSLTV